MGSEESLELNEINGTQLCATEYREAYLTYMKSTS